MQNINNNNNVTKFSGARLDFLNKLNQNASNSQQNSLSKGALENKILPGSEILSKENPDMIIYKYPSIKFSRNVGENCKILLFFGENKDMFINSFINIYRDITSEDKFRYKLVPNNTNKLLDIYDIKARSFKYNAKIICFNNFIKNKKDYLNYETMLELCNLFINDKITKKMHYLFITLDELKKLDKYELTFFYLFINLFTKEKIKNKIMVLYSSNKFNENMNANINIINNLFNYEKDDYFVFEENFDSYFSSLFNPEFHYINNNILYDKNNKQEYNKLYEKLALIAKKINESKKEEINMNMIKLIKNIISSQDLSIINQSINELKAFDKKELIILLYFIINSNAKNDISKFIIFLYEKINSPKKFPTSEIILTKDKYLQRNLFLYSKIVFTFLEKINFSNCDLDDENVKNIKNIFTSKLTFLNLSQNKIRDITIINKESFISIQNLDLSNNKITDINIFSTYKMNNLKSLNLSYNEIIDIKTFSNEDSSNFNKLENLNLSNNKIIKLNKINIKTLKYIDLRNNQLSEGINDFINNNCYNINKLIIENCDNKLIFDYSDKCQIKFEYSVENENINNILKAISFKGIKSLLLDNFSNIEFLNNESLKDLIELNLNQNPINDITIFNQVKFINIEKIHLDELEIEKGFNSLHVFNSIKARSISLEPYGNKYFCKIEFMKPSIKTNIIFDNLNFLKDSLLTECTNINITQSILDNNVNFFSFSEIKNSFPIFKKLRANKLEINYNSFDKKYECNGYFNYNIKLKFIFNDNLFLRDNLFHDIYSIKIYNGILDDNLDLSIQKFPFLTNLELENNKIEGMKIFNDIDALQKENKEREKYNDMNYDKKSLINLKIKSHICSDNLLGNLFGDKIALNSIEPKNDKIKLNYMKPFNFEVLIDKNKFKEIKSFNECREVNITNYELSSNDLNFLKDGSLFSVSRLYLNLNESVNLDFLEKVTLPSLYRLKFVNKFTKNNFEYINNNFNCYEIDFKTDEKDKNYLCISFTYDKKYYIHFDYLYEVNKNLEILNNINLYRIYELKLENLNINKIDFLSNSTLTGLRILDLDNNKIDDISIFTKEKIKFKLYRLCLRNNPIKKGLHVLTDEIFNRSIYLEVNSLKKENEFKICLNYKYPFYDIEFYINNINDLINIIDYKNNFVKLNNNNKEMEQIENVIKENYSSENKKTIFDIILFIMNLRNNSSDTLNIIYNNESKEFVKNNNIYINDNNRILFEKAFKWISDKKQNYEERSYKLGNFICKWERYFSYINLHNLDSRHENIIIYFPFEKFYNLNLINCNFDLRIFQRTKFYSIEKIDLSQSHITDIGGLCGYVPFRNLKKLNLSNNNAITNLGELKEAQFTDLEELYLSNDNIQDLNGINLGDFKFYKLKILDLSHNLIQSLSPLKFFRNLKILNLEHNLINDEKELNYIIDLNNTCRFQLTGNNVSGASLGYFRMF